MSGRPTSSGHGRVRISGWAAAVTVALCAGAAAEDVLRVSVGSRPSEGRRAATAKNGRLVGFDSNFPIVSGDFNELTDVFVRDTKTGQVDRVSVSANGYDPDGISYEIALSESGRYAAFTSLATNLVPNDTNDQPDVFVHDRKTGVTKRISVTTAGEQSQGPSEYPSISADGRYVVFVSEGLLAPGGGAGAGFHPDVFLHDNETGTTTRVSGGDSESNYPSISPDGRYVVFESFATDLVEGDTNDDWDVFVYDRKSGTTTRVSVGDDGQQANSSSGLASISEDGKFVAFISWATNLGVTDTNGWGDIYVRDVAKGKTTRVSVSSAGDQSNEESLAPVISWNGRYVAFESYASNLVEGDTNLSRDIFVHDRKKGKTTRVSVYEDGAQAGLLSEAPAISRSGTRVAFTSFEAFAPDDVYAFDVYVRDWKKKTTRRATRSAGDVEGEFEADSKAPVLSASGRVVAFWSFADLAPDDTGVGATQDVYVRDAKKGVTERASVGPGGVEADGISYHPAVSGDGRYVAFASDATNLVPGDTNGHPDVFVYDRETGVVERVSVAADGAQATWISLEPSLSHDGRYVAFRSIAGNLVEGDTNGKWDIFVRDRKEETTTRVSVSSAGAEGNGDALEYPSISPDGRYVAFGSLASDHVAGDTEGFADIFLHDRKTGETIRVSQTPAGAGGQGASQLPDVSKGGKFVAFQSGATNLVPSDTNGSIDVLVYHRKSMGLTRATLASTGVESSLGGIVPTLSDDGRWVAFLSDSDDLVSGDTNGVSDLFMRDLKKGKTRRVSRTVAGAESNVAISGRPALSGNGKIAAAASGATNLVFDDSNAAIDVFLFARD